MTAMESSVQKIREAQEGKELKKEILELVEIQLQTHKAQIDAQVRDWTGSIVQGCQEMADQIEGIQKQLEEFNRSRTSTRPSLM